MKHKQEKYKISIDGKWDLHDLYNFPRIYGQVYAFLRSFLPDMDDSHRAYSRVIGAYKIYPWKGGWSTVNFYDSLSAFDGRPPISSIRYSSPGWVEIVVFIAGVKAIADFIRDYDTISEKVGKLCGQGQQILLRIMKKTPKNKDNPILDNEDIESLIKVGDDLIKMWGLSNIVTMEKLNERTECPVKSLKILLSLRRRIEKLVEYKINGKVKFSDSTGKKDNN